MSRRNKRSWVFFGLPWSSKYFRRNWEDALNSGDYLVSHHDLSLPKYIFWNEYLFLNLTSWIILSSFEEKKKCAPESTEFVSPYLKEIMSSSLASD